MSEYFVLKLARLILIASLVVGACVSSATAQESGVGPGESLTTNPKQRQTTITATVPDRIDPSTPILIAPENNSLLQDPTPSLVWQIATDNVGIASYSLYLDGAVLFSGIPTTATETSSYTLTYSSSTMYYTLTPKSSLANGTHTWKIRALDAAGNFTDSATWSFEIDSKAPSFVITQIEDITVSISAQDLDTVPTDPHRLTANEPILSGTGESGSSVKVTVRGEGMSTSGTTFAIGSSGKWSWQIGIIPRDVIVYLDFLITDAAGNISILKDVPLLLKSASITIPGFGTTSPTTIPGHPTGPTPTPVVSIPALSPAEWRHRMLDQVTPYLPPSLQATVKQEFLSPVVTAVQPQSFKRSLGPLVLITPVAVSFGALAVLAGPAAGLGVLWQLLLLLLPLLRRKYCGQVFFYQNSKGVPYVPVTFTRIGADEDYSKTLVTTIHGYFNPGSLPEGTYLAAVHHPGFPLQLSREHHNQSSWYLGEKLAVQKNANACLSIPITQQKSEPFSKQVLLLLAVLTSPRSPFRWIWVALGGFLIFLYPSNTSVALFLLIVVVYSIDTIMAHFLRD